MNINDADQTNSHVVNYEQLQLLIIKINSCGFRYSYITVKGIHIHSKTKTEFPFKRGDLPSLHKNNTVKLLRSPFRLP